MRVIFKIQTFKRSFSRSLRTSQGNSLTQPSASFSPWCLTLTSLSGNAFGAICSLQGTQSSRSRNGTTSTAV